MSGLPDNQSPQYHVRHWRSVPEETENTLEDFLAWLEYDKDNMEESDVTLIKSLVNEYLGRDMKKVKQGEKEMLNRWKESNA